VVPSCVEADPARSSAHTGVHLGISLKVRLASPPPGATASLPYGPVRLSQSREGPTWYLLSFTPEYAGPINPFYVIRNAKLSPEFVHRKAAAGQSVVVDD
jgi:hypothetical protein